MLEFPAVRYSSSGQNSISSAVLQFPRDQYWQERRTLVITRIRFHIAYATTNADRYFAREQILPVTPGSLGSSPELSDLWELPHLLEIEMNPTSVALQRQSDPGPQVQPHFSVLGAPAFETYTRHNYRTLCVASASNLMFNQLQLMHGYMGYDMFLNDTVAIFDTLPQSIDLKLRIYNMVGGPLYCLPTVFVYFSLL